MIKILPISGAADEITSIQLNGKTYDFRIRWNSFEECWYLYVGLVGETPKIKTKAVNGTDLLAPYSAYEETPDGYLFLIDTEQTYGRPSRDNLGPDKRFKFYFIDKL